MTSRRRSRDSSPSAGRGLHHVALWSTDVAADVAKLRDLGVPLEDREPRDGFTGRLSYLAASAFDGARLEVVEPEAALAGNNPLSGHITRIDHVVLRVPSVAAVSEHFDAWFGVPTKRTMERGEQAFAFMRPGDIVIEVIGPKTGGEPGSGRIAGLAFEVREIDALTEHVRGKGYPIGEPHPALQGGRIVSIHPTGAAGCRWRSSTSRGRRGRRNVSTQHCDLAVKRWRASHPPTRNAVGDTPTAPGEGCASALTAGTTSPSTLSLVPKGALLWRRPIAPRPRTGEGLGVRATRCCQRMPSAKRINGWRWVLEEAWSGYPLPQSVGSSLTTNH